MKTRALRGANIFGMNPKRSIILYDDNCQVHGKEEQRKQWAEKKIIERSLIPNATHIQQPVDQHVGVAYKDNVKDKYEDWVEIVWDKWDKKIITKKISAKERRAKICELSFEAAKELKQKQHLLESAWINLGVDLPFDGSKDGDVTTIHKDGIGNGRSRLEDADNSDESGIEDSDIELIDTDED